MSNKQLSGSAKLWAKSREGKAPTDHELHEAISVAKDSYKILRWWKYGQPVIDHIDGMIDVKPEAVGAFIQSLINLHGEGTYVNINGGFPYGVVAIDGVILQVGINREA